MEFPVIPHAVPFDQNAARVVFGVERHHERRRKIFLLLDGNDICKRMLQELFAVLYLTFLAEDQKRSLFGLEIGLSDRICEE